MVTEAQVQAARKNRANNTTGEMHPFFIRGKDISEMVPYWDKVDTIVEGYDAVKAATTDFLPMFPDEEEKDYEFRLECTKLTNIYRDTLEGLATKPFEEEISLIGGDEIPEEAVSFIENVDGAGNNLSMFSALTFFSGINDAINWIFVDYPKTTGRKLSRADAKSQNIKPFWSHVLARNIYEVRSDVIGGEEVLVYIRIFEPSSSTEGKDCFRIFERDKVTNVVTWQLWEYVPTAKKIEQEFVMIDSGTLSIKVIPLVPFITGRRNGRTFKFLPPMRDAADLQVTLYKDESALQFIKTMAGYPMLAANGMKPALGPDGKTPKKVGIGPMKVLYGVPDGAGGHGTWQFIEPNANSMEFLQKNIDKTKQDLRELGRQPLTALSSQLTTVTTSIAAGKARSAVTAWALALKDALENAMKITMLYMGKTDEIEVNVYTGFDNIKDDGSDLEALDKARERRDLSQETFLFELQRRKVLAPEFKYEDEVAKILNETPSEYFQTNQNPNDANTGN